MRHHPHQNKATVKKRPQSSKHYGIRGGPYNPKESDYKGIEICGNCENNLEEEAKYRQQREAYNAQERAREESRKKEEKRKRKLLGLESETDEDEVRKAYNTALYKKEEDHPFFAVDPRNQYVQDNFKFKD